LKLYKAGPKLLLLLLPLCLPVICHAAITIDSVHTTPSTCANNGSITIYALSGGSTMLYSITSGPNTRAPQLGDQFASLPAGIYTLMVTDLNNDTTKIKDTISGQYASPNFSPTYTDPPCPGSSTGEIIGNPLINTGTPPFTWVLTNLTTHVATTQSSDTFSNLPPASYSLRESDSCGNFATYSVTLATPNDSFSINQVVNEIIPCDSVRLKITLFILNSLYAPPYTIKIQTHNGTYQHTITDLTYSGPSPFFTEDVGGVSYGDYINITITDACGRSSYLANTVADYHLQINFTAQPGSCAIGYIAAFTLEGDSTQSNVNTTYFPDPVTVIVRNASTGAFIDSTVTNDTSTHFSQYGYSAPLTGNQNYSIEVKDGCGHVYTEVYAWPVTPAPINTGYVFVSSCMDSTACYEFQWTYTFFTDPTFELLSGPGYISSTKPNYVYNDTIIYPKTFLGIGGSNGYFLQLTNLAAGTYHYRVFDSCGNSITDSFTIRKQDLNSDNFTAHYIKGCPGQNVVSTKNDNFSYAFLSGTGISTLGLTSPTDTVINLNYGTYIASFYYIQSTYAIAINQNPTCQVIRDTINIPAYIPPQISYADQIACHGTMYLAFQPDSAAGVAPYKYEILSGPLTTGVQSSNLFTLSLPGSYLARVTDSCGYASTFSFTIDTSSFTDVVKAGSSCVGYSATLSAEYSPYATYVWQLPSGGTYVGDSLVLSPIVASDFGLYNLKKIVSINGCKDTFYTTYTFAGNSPTQTYASICPGQSILFGGLSYSLAGTYLDTIHTSSCDSIVALNLTIKGPVYDSVAQTICPGQSVTIGLHTYTATGIYRDTFVTAGCDSIHILNLHLNSYSYDSISTMICPGQSFLFGGIARSAAGLYYDTIPTTGCDSIVTLNLTIRGPLYDSVSQTICQGTSASAGIHTYTTTGIHRDTIATGGCDSIHVLNLHVAPYGTSAISQIICPGQSYLFGGTSLTLAGVYQDTIPTTACDSIVTLTLSIRGPLYDSVSQTICQGSSASAGTHTYTSTGIYYDTIATGGCDSIHVLNLTVTPYGQGSVSQVLCPGQNYLFGGTLLTLAGVYYDTIPTTGCDSIVTLTLSIRGPLYDSVSQTICAGQSVSVDIHNYTVSGLYYDTIATGGCDSIHVLNLQVTPYLTGSVSTVICPGQTLAFGGNTLSQAGVYYDTIPTIGCDSIVTLTLSIRGPVYDSVSQTICAGQSASVGMHNYTSTGLYYDTIATAGCDSIHVLNLTVTPYSTGSVSTMICPGQTLVFGSSTLSQAGVYYDTIPTTGCDSIVTLTLSIRGPLYDSVTQTICAGNSVAVGANIYTSSGIFRDTIPTAGCDSIYVLDLKVSPYITSSFSANICPGQSVSVGSNTYSTSGTYIDTVSASAGCDTVITTHLTVISPIPQTQDTNGICALMYQSQLYTSDATVIDTFSSILGCDSIYLSVNIHITPPGDTVINSAACIYFGQSYNVGGQAHSAPGTYSDTLHTALGGCDSVIINTNLRVITPQYTSQHIDSCYTATVGGISYTSDTLLRDTIQSACGLDSIIAVDSIHLYEPSVIVISSSQLPIIAGESTQLTITPSGDYQNIIWSPNYDISSITSPNPTVSPRQDTTYYVTAEDQYHCIVSAQIQVTVVGNDEPDFLMPTAFSPNGDGNNDIYRPVIKNGPLDVLSFQIYDRWGQKVYDNEITGIVGWDGTYRNVKQPIGVYIYYIQVKLSSGNIVKQSGNLTLIR